MSSHYYLVSSLPAISSDSAKWPSYESFLDSCSNVVGPKVFEQLQNLSLDSDKGPLVKEWAGFYGTLKREVNLLRREKLGLEKNGLTCGDYVIQTTAAAAVEAENPLEAEKILLKAQFDFLDSCVQSHFFDDVVLFGYAMKLKLLERQGAFTQPAGKAEFERLFSSIQNQIMSM